MTITQETIYRTDNPERLLKSERPEDCTDAEYAQSGYPPLDTSRGWGICIRGVSGMVAGGGGRADSSTYSVLIASPRLTRLMLPMISI
jgi:hypothetical protein